MAVFKGKFDTSFAVIPNEALQDKTLSFEATGLLAMMLSLPDDWAIHKSWLQQQKIKCGRDKLTSMMNELIDSGYVVRKVKQKEDGRLDGVDWEVFPTVQLKNRKTVKPSDGKSDTTKETVIQKKQDTKINVPAKASTSKTYPDEFEWLWTNKPNREGGNPKKQAYSACKARLKDGSTWREMAEGLKRYKAYCEAKGLINTPMVQQMSTFFGTKESFKESWGYGDEGHQTNSKLRQQATDGLSDSQRAIAAARAQRDGNTEASRPPMGSNGSVVYEQVGQDEWSDSQQLVVKGNSEPF